MTVDKYTEEWLEREFVGYGFNTPDPQWPGAAKVCEENILEGDRSACSDYLELAPKSVPLPPDVRFESSEMMYEFGAREGVPRLLNVFNKYKIPTTWNIYTRALQKAPYWIKPIIDSGAEMSLGGHRYRNNFEIDPEKEDALIEQSIDTLQSLTGDKTLPKGWLVERRSNLSIKLYSLAHSSRSLPLLYSSDSCSDDLPYWIPSPVEENNDGLLMVPFSYDCSDLRFKMRGSGFTSPKDYFLHLRDTFDVLYEEGEEGEGKMMTVLLHPHLIGRPNRLFWLEEFIKYITAKPGGAWIARRQDIAEHWKEHFPYDPKTAFGQTPVPACG